MAKARQRAPFNEVITFRTLRNVIDGRLRDAPSRYTGYNPTTEKKFWETPIATKQDLDDAVVAANRAFPDWKKMPWEEKSRLFRQYAEEVAQHATELVELLLLETGKPVGAAGKGLN